MKIYERPNAELQALDFADVITASATVSITQYVDGDSGFNFGGSDFWD